MGACGADRDRDRQRNHDRPDHFAVAVFDVSSVRKEMPTQSTSSHGANSPARTGELLTEACGKAALANA